MRHRKLLSNLNSSMTMGKSNSFLSPFEILPIDKKEKKNTLKNNKKNNNNKTNNNNKN